MAGFSSMNHARGGAGVFDVDRLLRLTGPRPLIAVAFSGGVDSTVLAHALCRARRKLGGLRLLHVDHGLQPASGDWARHCARLARRWRVPLVTLHARIERRRGESPEAAARDARYALLARAMEPGEVLVTAQHRDDQVETLLLQLFRGAGVNGLAAMPAIAAFGAGRIARPLLEVSRADIERHAMSHELHWVEDPTNAHTQFARNRLRHEILPRIRAYWTGLDAAVARSARHMSEAGALLDGLARDDLDAAADGAGLSVTRLRALPAARRRNALRAFIARAGALAPDTSRLAEITGPLLSARSDAQPEVRWGGAVMRRRDGRLELKVTSEDTAPAKFETGAKSWDWLEQREWYLNTDDRLTLLDDDAGPIDLDRLPKRVEIRSRTGGESLRPGPRARTQALKKLIQAAKMSIEERARLPLLYSGQRLIAAGDRWMDASISANDKSRHRARLKWTRTR
jgi:tRNA(Ile)-lysidine synthase